MEKHKSIDKKEINGMVFFGHKRKTIFNSEKRRKEFFFYLMLVAIPFAQYLVMYVGVNLRSLLFIFQKYDPYNARYVTSFEYLKNNIVECFRNLTGGGDVNLTYAWRNTLAYYFTGLFMTFFNLVCCFFIYKKLFLAEYFKLVFFIPTTFSGFLGLFAFRYFVERGLPAMFPDNVALTEGGGLISNTKYVFWTLYFYNFIGGIGGGLIWNVGFMSRTSKEVIEAATLDGVNFFQEFIHVVWPVIYPIVTIGLYTGVTGIFLAGPPTYAFFGENAPKELVTFGYYMFTQVVGSKASNSAYPLSATFGVMFTLVAAPLVFLLKHFFEKNDPNN